MPMPAGIVHAGGMWSIYLSHNPLSSPLVYILFTFQAIDCNSKIECANDKL